MTDKMRRREADDPEFPAHVAALRGPNLRCEGCGCIMADDRYALCQLCEARRPLRDRVLEIALRNRDACGYNCDCHDELSDLFDALVDASPSETTGAEVRRCPMCRSVPHVYDNYGPANWTPAQRSVECKNAACYVSGRVVPIDAWNGSAPPAGDGVPRVEVRAVKWKIGPEPSDPLRFHEDIFVEERVNIDGDVRYAVTQRGNCLRKDGHWEYEPQPSSRDDEFFARCRYATIKEALAALSYCATRQGGK